jgi:ATP-dependent DNA helicase DinG
MNKLTIPEIKQMIDDVFPNFNFRRYQKQTIAYIISKFLENPKSKIILDAPTGAGKSIIAMVVSKVLNTKFDKKGYIITSDTFLQDQYENSTEHFGLEIPSIKGLDRYDCTENLMKISLGKCKIDRLSEMERRNLPCYSECPYYSARDNAADSDTAILNYNYWLIYQYNNIYNNNDDQKESLFPMRDFVIFDEAHKVVNIINNYFSPVIDMKILNDSDIVLSWLMEQNMIKPAEYESTRALIESGLNLILQDLSDDEFKSLNSILANLDLMIKKQGTINEALDKVKKSSNLSAREYRVLKSIGNLSSIYTKLEDYIGIVKDNPKELMIRTGDGEGENGVRYYCFDESLIMKKFHEFYKFGLFMSATFLNHEFFSKYSSMEDVEVIKIPATFDYSNSPVYYNKSFDMSYKNKDVNILNQIKYIDKIVDKYESGVIHTGSYFNSDTLLKNSKHKEGKIRVYKNTEQKKYLLEKLFRDKNFFIAGPSLLEGVDLKGDISRCQIFMKIPFLSLGDQFVKVRSEKNFKWYLWETSLNFVQGIGRSNRSDEDYCDTWILDSTFDRLLNGNMIPDFIKNRIEKI